MRHTARLIATDPRNAEDLRQGHSVVPLKRFAKAALTPTVVALAATAALVAMAARQESLTGPVFRMLLALTVPHLVVVAAMDLAAGRRNRRR